ncbi:hypothetical protein CH370_16020 [Leptospira kmetyi]|uniref:Uncharacterized protein n=1 Tax=Leptospira kmetyi TaxID=408139 RepID=A0AAD0UKS3_9LEPT|nr:hypothetical protein EFP84_01340 [Leptospira kmetyi]PJZ28641.1 hypothetical protein CH378_16895 [Leptospira kmetyi]PJZ40416.1 hypothetical protein CH370_16020 [Leptospira kmetyi]
MKPNSVLQNSPSGRCRIRNPCNNLHCLQTQFNKKKLPGKRKKYQKQVFLVVYSHHKLKIF